MGPVALIGAPFPSWDTDSVAIKYVTAVPVRAAGILASGDVSARIARLNRGGTVMWNRREGLLILGLLILSASAILTVEASESVVFVADQSLTQYWRTVYDILVRPAGARSAIEAKYGLVEPNFLSNLTGGISIAQYEAIKSIPGIEVAAPEGLLTYLTITASSDRAFPEPAEPGVYLLEQIETVDDGLQVQEGFRNRCYRVIQPEDLALGYPPVRKCLGGGLAGLTPGVVYPLGFIDPEQEARLVGLDQALVEGEYLTGREPIWATSQSPEGLPTSAPNFPIIRDVPVLLNTTPYISVTLSARLLRVLLPPNLSLERFCQR
jgi:hypothetical protein